MQDSKRSPERDRWVVQGYMVWRTNRPFVPPTDVIELNEKVIVRVEIGGMKAGDFTVSLGNRQLTISGYRERPIISGAAYHQVEIGYGDFQVDLALPYVVDRETVTAAYRDGILEIDLPRFAEGQRYIIPVQNEGQQDNG
jgi:HSP20 family protein